jgi:hypothetical protein
VRHSGDDLTTAPCGQFRKDEISNGSTDFGKTVSVEEKERRVFVTAAQELYCFGEGAGLTLVAEPFSFDRRIALRILAVLRASSCARCSVEADDKLPTPVFEKLGSGL